MYHTIKNLRITILDLIKDNKLSFFKIYFLKLNYQLCIKILYRVCIKMEPFHTNM